MLLFIHSASPAPWIDFSSKEPCSKKCVRFLIENSNIEKHLEVALPFHLNEL